MELKTNDNLGERLDLIFSSFATQIESLVSKADGTSTGNIFSSVLDMNGHSIVNAANIDSIASGTTPSDFMRYATYDYDNDGIVTTAKDIHGLPGKINHFYGTNAAGTLGVHPMPDGTGDMLKSVYDTDDDGVLPSSLNAVRAGSATTATETVKVDGVDAAANSTYYGTSGTTVGFYTTPFLPIGSIVIWSGAITAIPTGWAVCNGNGGTPNLIDRFVLHADGITNTVGSSGEGSNSTTSTTLSLAQLALHDHDLKVGLVYSTNLSNPVYPAKRVISAQDIAYPYESGVISTGSVNTSSAGSSSGHLHTMLNKKPKYYALAYIMRIS